MGFLTGNTLTQADFEWNTYTPTVTGFTLGNGTIEGRYAKLGDTITAEVLVTLGSTSAVTGAMTITIPFVSAFSKHGGLVLASPTGAGSPYRLNAYATAASTLVGIAIIGASGALAGLTSTTPATWAPTGWLLMQVTYEAA